MSYQAQQEENTGQFSPEIQMLKEILNASLSPIKDDISSIKKALPKYDKLETRVETLEKSRTFWRDNWHKVITTSVLCISAIFGIAIWKGEQDAQIKSNDVIEATQLKAMNEMREMIMDIGKKISR